MDRFNLNREGGEIRLMKRLSDITKLLWALAALTAAMADLIRALKQ